MTATLSLTNDISEFQRLARAIDDFCSGHSLAKRLVHDTTLAVEEIFSNIINHAYDDENVHQITCHIYIENDQLNLEVTDDGRPFNPLTVPAPDIYAPLENRCIGGLGIHIVRRLMDALDYQRVENRNILTLKITLAGANPA